MNRLPATFSSVTAGGPDTVFGIASDGTVWEHNPAGNKQLSSTFLATQLSAAQTQQGADEVFMTLIDGSFWEYSTAFPSVNPFDSNCCRAIRRPVVSRRCPRDEIRFGA